MNKYIQKPGSENVYKASKEPIKIVIPGRPVPKERPRLTVDGRRRHVYTPRGTSYYEKEVAFAALIAAKGRILKSELYVYIKLFFADRKYGDLDNYAKCILDGLQGALYDNDKQVARLIIERYFDKNERAEVIVEEVGDGGDV